MRSCPGCGYLVPETWETCFKCGTALAPPQQQPQRPQSWPPPTPPTPAGATQTQLRPRAVLIASAIGAVIVLLVGAIVVANTGNSSTASSASAPTVSAPTIPEPPPAPMPVGHVPVSAALASELREPGTRSAVIDLDQADKLVDDLAPVRGRALLAHDEETLHQLETGSALASDLSNCGCPAPTINSAAAATAGDPDASSLVPRQTRYPASFFSELLLFGSGGRKYHDFLIMTRAAASQPWKVAFETAYESTSPTLDSHPGVFDHDNFDIVPPALRVPPRQLLNDLALQWQHQKIDGAGFPGSPFRNSEGSERAIYRQDSINGANGLRGHFTYRVDPRDPVFVYGLDQGAAFVCGTIYTDIVWTAGDAVPQQDALRETWGQTLEPGVYKRLTEHRFSQPCILFGPGPGDGAQVFEGDQATVLVQGTSPNSA